MITDDLISEERFASRGKRLRLGGGPARHLALAWCRSRSWGRWLGAGSGQHPGLSTPSYPQVGFGGTVRQLDRGTLIIMPNPADDLPRDVRELLRRNRGVVLTADAKQAGLSEARLRRLTAASKLRRLTHGAYVDAKAFADLDRWQRFKLEARAFGLLCGPNSFLTGWGCTAVRDFPTLGPAAEAGDGRPTEGHVTEAVHRNGWPSGRSRSPVGTPLAARTAAGDE